MGYPSILTLARSIDNEISGLVGNWDCPIEQPRYRGDAYEQAYERFQKLAEGVPDDPQSDGIHISDVYDAYGVRAGLNSATEAAMDRICRYFLPKVAQNIAFPATIRSYAYFIMAAGLENPFARVQSAAAGTQVAERALHGDIRAYRRTAIGAFNDANERTRQKNSPENRAQRRNIETLLGKGMPWVEVALQRYHSPFSLREGLSENDILRTLT
jgi:hypothetical protein